MEEKQVIVKKFLELTEKEREIQLYSSSGIPEEYYKFNWNDYNVNKIGDQVITDNDTIQSRKIAKKTALEYCSEIIKQTNKGKSILFIGVQSSGKTVLATLILREYIHRVRNPVLFVRFSFLCSEASASFDNETLDLLRRKYIEPSVLCIDEIEEAETTGWIKRFLADVLDQRRDQQKPTILTSKIYSDKIRESCGVSVYNLITNDNAYKECFILTDKDKSVNRNHIAPYAKYDVNRLAGLLKNFSQKENFDRKIICIDGETLVKFLEETRLKGKIK